MALSLNNIDINCTEGLKIANDLSSAAAKLYRYSNTGDAILSDLGASWTGDSATAFLTKLEEQFSSALIQSEALDELATAIEKTVAVYRQMQLDAYREEQKKNKDKTITEAITDSNKTK